MAKRESVAADVARAGKLLLANRDLVRDYLSHIAGNGGGCRCTNTKGFKHEANCDAPKIKKLIADLDKL